MPYPILILRVLEKRFVHRTGHFMRMLINSVGVAQSVHAKKSVPFDTQFCSMYTIDLSLNYNPKPKIKFKNLNMNYLVSAKCLRPTTGQWKGGVARG